MALIGGRLGEFILTKAQQLKNNGLADEVSEQSANTASNLKNIFGDSIAELVLGKTVIDYGCGTGRDTIQIAKWGASKAIGIDIQEHFLELGKNRAAEQNVGDICQFCQATDCRADIIISKDAFEHYGDPAKELSNMYNFLKEGGCVLISFGPVWYHPVGGHSCSVFPWAHLICSEKSIIRWRGKFKNDGATNLSEIAGGLNKMTVKRFLKIVEDSPFNIASIEITPIRKLKLIHCSLTKEFTTSMINCKLVKEPFKDQ